MASTEEVLSTLLADDYIHSSIQFLIDENMRTVTVPPEGVVLGVTGDKDVNRINFKMVRFYDGLDLSTFQIRINYVNANGDANYYQVTDTTIEDDYILFTWLVSSDAAAYKGTVSFAARLYTVEDTIVKESFNSTVATAEVLEGIIVDEYMPPDAQQDLISLLMSQIKFPAGSNVGQIDDTEGASAHGEIFNDYERNEATGGFSHAEGNSTTASGANSHAEGSDTTASGNCAHAEGYSTSSTGSYSHAEGKSCKAEGSNGSHAEGDTSTASGEASHAEGYNAQATGYASHAEGQNTTASSTAAHAEGSGTTASKYYSHAEGSGTTASGTSSHAEGDATTASGYYSHAEGGGSNATADKSHAEGNSTQASGYAAHAEGSGTIASGAASHAEGSGTKASSANQHVQGKYNIEDTAVTYAMIIGNGTADDARSNALTVDWSGNIECGTVNGVDVTQISSGGSGVGQIDATEGAQYHGEIFNTYSGEGKNIATANFSHAEGYKTSATGAGSHAEGYYTIASAHASHAEGYETTASDAYAHSEGYKTIASKMYSHAEGFNTKASSENQHVQGKFNVEDTNGTYAMIIGNGSSDTARSNALTVDWNGNIECGTVNGVDVTQISGGSDVGQVDSNSDGTGEIFNCYEWANKGVLSFSKNKATGLYAHAEGGGTTASGVCSHAEGHETTASGNFSHAEGKRTTASGTYAHAEGENTYATGQRSHAEGYHTKASSNYQHVSGTYNIEDTDGTYAMIIGNGTGSSPSNALTVDWSGNIECGTVNGVDVTQLSSGGVGQTAPGLPINAEIFNNYTLNKATANHAHAEGSNTTASNTCAHAEGSSTTASGASSHAEGDSTTASGYWSHAEGQGCVASGSHSHAEGVYTKASSDYQHVSGMFNVEDTAKKYAIIIGNGTEPSVLSNAFTVDWNGNIQCGKTDASGNFTTNGTINGIDIVALAARVAALEGGTS